MGNMSQKQCDHILESDIKIKDITCEKCPESQKTDGFTHLCLACGDLLCGMDNLKSHNQKNDHHYSMILCNQNLHCDKCDSHSEKVENQQANNKLEEIRNLPKAKQLKTESRLTYSKLVEGLKNNEFSKISIMTGAGISVSAGIPDFRSANGLYNNDKLKKYDLNKAEDIFSISFFLQKPKPFYQFMKDFDLDGYDATPTHYFIKFLEEKNKLLINLTQNIDNLESKTEINMKKVIQCHGANRGAHCAGCKKVADAKELQKSVKEEQVYYCGCGDPIKPDITFFGESLPEEFGTADKIMKNSDLLIVIGTSLVVSPFCTACDYPQSHCPSVLINMENTEKAGYDFDDEQNNPQKLFLQGKCDDTVRKIVKDCGWIEEFEKILPEKHKGFKYDEMESNLNDLENELKDLKINDKKENIT